MSSGNQAVSNDSTRDSEILAYRFQFEVSGVIEATEVVSVSGFDLSIDAQIKMESDGSKQHIIKIPGQTGQVGPLQIRRALTSNMDFWDWMEDVVDSKDPSSYRYNGRVTMYNSKGTPVGEWIFENAWPSAVSLSGLDSSSSGVAMEDLTIQIETLYYY